MTDSVQLAMMVWNTMELVREWQLFGAKSAKEGDQTKVALLS